MTSELDNKVWRTTFFIEDIMEEINEDEDLNVGDYLLALKVKVDELVDTLPAPEEWVEFDELKKIRRNDNV